MSDVALSEEHLDHLLDKVYTARGWDFRRYRRSSIKRCIERRIAISRLTYPAYVESLDSEPLEFNLLFNQITIKVSEFFRDPEVFRRIEDYVIPMTLRRLTETGSTDLRIWSCGCAKGEEPISMAILINKLLNETGHEPDLKIFGTDIDEAAVDSARKGVFIQNSLKNVNPVMRSQLFQAYGSDFKIMPQIRNLVTFGAHDIVSNIQLSRMDIILCRNLLIYFEKELQEKVFEKFYYSLKPGGFIVLGKSEVPPLRFRNKLIEVRNRERIYQKVT
ncbi:MAG TPA: protein-glutamate O-methyltransferase CheR [Nitrospirota bacterium]|nr:protein-glutamate O-methyltransferase CheR [Nitrospirota bacterium]